MKHEVKNIDQQLRDVESQSLPDLSKIDEHWQQMKAQLTLSEPGVAKAPVKYGGWIVVAAAAVVMLSVVWSSRKSNNAVNDLSHGTNTSTTPLPLYQDTIPAKKNKQRPIAYKKQAVAASSAEPAAPKAVSDTSAQPKKVNPARSARKSSAPAKRKESPETGTMPDTSSRPKKAVPAKRIYKAPDSTFKATRKVPTKKRVLLKARTTDGRDTVLEATVIEQIEIPDTLKLEPSLSSRNMQTQQFLNMYNRNERNGPANKPVQHISMVADSGKAVQARRFLRWSQSGAKELQLKGATHEEFKKVAAGLDN